MLDLGAYYELEVACRGTADPVTGYLMNISEIDAAVRELAIPRIETAVRADPQPATAHVLRELVDSLNDRLNDSVLSIAWHLTPFHAVTIERADMNRYLLSQQFEFAAAHRLHCPSLSDAENQRTFGRCNNANGHGHNYRLEVVVSLPMPDAGAAPVMGLAQLERIVDAGVVDRFDHTHLNLDTAEFAELNPSVEHIAKICHQLLTGPVSDAGGRLERVTVWETEKTSCTYPAG